MAPVVMREILLDVSRDLSADSGIRELDRAERAALQLLPREEILFPVLLRRPVVPQRSLEPWVLLAALAAIDVFAAEAATKRDMRLGGYEFFTSRSREECFRISSPIRNRSMSSN